jgi:hypothetical protein
MHIEVLSDDFGPHERRGVGDSRRVSALLRLLGIRDFPHDLFLGVNCGVMHTPPNLHIFPGSPKGLILFSHFVVSDRML